MITYEIQDWHTLFDTQGGGVTAYLTESPPFDEGCCNAVLFYTERRHRTPHHTTSPGKTRYFRRTGGHT